MEYKYKGDDMRICSICGEAGANYWTALHALSRFNHYHKECVEREAVACGGWTEGQADSARYKQLGNAVAVPVAEWIGRRICQSAEITTTPK